ncbi:class I SAM-dependent methyltransferase [Kribbella qitaiheensis]|uniref:Class I SAM-dependent methyltransferase n=2 Tax=Kribbella qitaiheensis TaxID=1544730 RepID=A0A7G6X9F8_9ACTN|nr:class I SAM-dependent methyltransferase [Kribbella qitaiheensis]
MVLSVARWRAAAGRRDRWLLLRCQGPTVDLGCGPGRLVEALLRKGIPVLGVDCSALAVRYCLLRGAPVLHGDVFAPLPAEGSWRHVVLADGNIGIGGDPVTLLRRATRLLAPGGSILVETGPRRSELWQGHARLQDPSAAGAWFPWAVVGLNAVSELARRAGLRVVATRRGRTRCFAQLAQDDCDERAGRGINAPDHEQG